MSNFYVKKKKKSFLKIAKEQEKFGKCGRGYNLSEEEYHYYIRVYEHLKHVEEDEKDILARNLFRELEREGNIKSLSTNQIISRILDDTLPLASFSQVISFLNVFSSDLRFFCVDPFASHVLQTLLTLSLKYIQDRIEGNKPEQLPSDEQKEEFKSFILKTAKFVYNNLNEFVCEMYTSHIVRTVLEVCSGVVVAKSIRSSIKTQISHSIEEDSKQVFIVPDELSTLLKSIARRLMQLPNFTEVIACERGSATLQATLCVLTGMGETEILGNFVEHILQQGFGQLSTSIEHHNSGIHPLFEYISTSMLMELTVSSASAKQQQQIWEKFFSGNLAEIVSHQFGNFTIQKLLSSWKAKVSFPAVYDETAKSLKKAFRAGKSGVVLALVEACRRLGCCQENCLKKVMKLMKCWKCDDKSKLKFVLSLLYLIPLKEFELKREANQLPPYSLHGTLILQQLMNFKESDQVISSLLALPTSDVVQIACDPRGSHVVTAFMKSSHVKETDKEKFISKLEGNLMSLVCNKHGSRSLEDLWNAARLTTKTNMCQELADNRSKLKESVYGHIIIVKFQIDSFIKTKGNQSWEEVQEKKQKKRIFLNNWLKETDDLVKQPTKRRKL